MQNQTFLGFWGFILRYEVANSGGRAAADDIYDRHNTLTALLTKLGVSPELAERDACRMEHYMSEETFQAIKKYFESELEKKEE